MRSGAAGLWVRRLRRINKYFNLIARLLIVAVHLQLIGLSIVNHFRPELLLGLLVGLLSFEWAIRKALKLM